MTGQDVGCMESRSPQAPPLGTLFTVSHVLMSAMYLLPQESKALLTSDSPGFGSCGPIIHVC